MKKLSSTIKALTLAMLAVSLAAANAQSVFTNNSTDGLWHTAANWTPAGVPTAATNVLIDGPDATVSVPSDADNITVSRNAATGFTHLRVGSSTTLNMTSLTVGGGVAGGLSVFRFDGNGTANVSGNVTLVPGVGRGNLAFHAPGTLNVGGGSGSIINGGGAEEARIAIRAIDPIINAATVGADTLYLGLANSTGSFAINAGQTYNIDQIVSLFGTANTTLNLNGGNLTTGQVLLNDTGGATGNSTLNLNAGTLSANSIRRATNGASQVFNWNNGTISNGTGNLALDRGAGATQNLVISLGETGTRTFDISALNTATVTATATLANQAGANGTLTKAGAGTLILAGANTYTGATTVSAGTLAIGSTGSIATSAVILGVGGTLDVSAAPAFSFSGGQTLSGSGTVTGNVTMASGSTLAIGASPGTMTFFGDLTLAAGSTSNFEIDGLTAGITADLASGWGEGQTVNFGGTLNLLFQTGFNTVGTVQIFHFDNYAGNFTAVNTSGLASGFSATFNNVDGVVTVIPEPSTWALLAGGLAFVMAMRRRRNIG